MRFGAQQQITDDMMEYSNIDYKKYIEEELFRSIGIEIDKKYSNSINVKQDPMRGLTTFRADVVGRRTV